MRFIQYVVWTIDQQQTDQFIRTCNCCMGERLATSARGKGCLRGKWGPLGAWHVGTNDEEYIRAAAKLGSITAALIPVGSDGFYSSELQWVETKKNQHAEPYGEQTRKYVTCLLNFIVFSQRNLIKTYASLATIQIASCLAVAASAYDYSGPGLATWPSSGFFSGSTVYGAHGYRIGKRSASYGYGIALPTTLENLNNVHGHELASGYAISQPHPGAAGSYQQRTQLHSGYGKRSADADADAYYGAVATLENRNNVHGHEYASQYAVSQPQPS